MQYMMTDQEVKCMEISADLWNNWLELETQHKDDNAEFKFHLHSLQRCIQARAGFRAMEEHENFKRDI